MKMVIFVLEILILLLSCYAVLSLILMNFDLFPRGNWNFISCGTGFVAFVLFMYLLRIRKRI